MTRIQEAREALDRASRIVLEISPPSIGDDPALASPVRSMFYATTRLVRLIRRNSDLLRVAEEAVGAYEREHAVWAKRAHTAILRLKGLRRDAEKAFPALRPSTPPDREGEAWSNSLAHFDEIMGRVLATPPREHLSKDDTDTLCSILSRRLTECESRRVDHAVGMKNAVDDCRQELRHTLRGQLVLQRSHPGDFWKWVVAVNDAANPAPEEKRSIVAVPRSWRCELRPVFRLIHEPDPSEWPPDLSSPDPLDSFRKPDWRDIRQFAEQLRTGLANLVADLHCRLGQRASTVWILQRYSHRCTCLRRDELEWMLERTKKRERVLARDAAIFLFDQGFDVLPEQPQGTHRLDIKCKGLLVEAKIYDGRRRGLDAIVDGLTQIHSYANRLANQGDQVEPVLLVFRLGGPLATPVDEYKIGNLLVTIVHVDLGGSDESGCNAGPPELPVITAERISARLQKKQKRGTTKASRPREKN